MKDLILRTFKVNEKTWKKFKIECVKNNTNASIEIRNMIDKYIKK